MLKPKEYASFAVQRLAHPVEPEGNVQPLASSRLGQFVQGFGQVRALPPSALGAPACDMVSISPRSLLSGFTTAAIMFPICASCLPLPRN